MPFELPPAALASPPSESKFRAGKGEFPVQPSETVKARRRFSAANVKEARGFELPPPPTRSRKIIQMKPQKEEGGDEGKPPEKATPGPKASGGGKAAAGAASGKKKQPSATSAAGRKIARKTAHSLIERRRRSKMNEEFAVLKGLIPACTGEMHKLAILQVRSSPRTYFHAPARDLGANVSQASIEYVRYLEDCVAKLKAQRHEDAASGRPYSPSTLAAVDSFVPSQYEAGAESQPDVEMAGSAAPSPTFTTSSPRSSVSPAFPAQDRRESYSSASTDRRRYSYTTSATASPACGPQFGATLPPIGAALGSPALGPLERDPDQEATAALLMLNTDRRGYFDRGEERTEDRLRRVSGRGMSVKDLLST